MSDVVVSGRGSLQCILVFNSCYSLAAPKVSFFVEAYSICAAPSPRLIAAIKARLYFSHVMASITLSDVSFGSSTVEQRRKINLECTASSGSLLDNTLSVGYLKYVGLWTKTAAARDPAVLVLLAILQGQRQIQLIE